MNAHTFDWTEEREALLTELVKAGKGDAFIADELGAEPEVVNRKVQRLGLGGLRTSGPARFTIQADRQDAFRADWANTSLTMADLCRKWAVSHSSLRRLAQDLGLSAKRAVGFNWSEDRVSRLIELCSQGAKHEAIAFDLGCSKKAVAHKIEHLGLQRKRQPKREAPLSVAPHRVTHIDWTDENIAKLKTLWSSGVPTSDIQAGFRCPSRSAIIAKANRLGFKRPPTMIKEVPPPPPPKAPEDLWTEEMTATLRDMFADGCSNSEIARATGATRSAVGSKLSRMGLVRDPSAHLLNTRRLSPKQPKPQRIITGNGAIMEKPAARPSPVPMPKAAAWLPLPGVEPVRFVDARPQHCRWPLELGDGQFWCCGAEIARNSYCQVHDRRKRASNQPAKLTAKSLRRFA